MKYLILFTLTAVFFAFEQIGSHRKEYSWLPWWITSNRNWFGVPDWWILKNFDGFHISLWTSRILCIITGAFIILGVFDLYGFRLNPILNLQGWYLFAVWVFLWWVYTGMIFSFLFHYGFIKKSYWGWNYEKKEWDRL